MEFKVKVLQNKRSIGLRSLGAENMAQAESGLLQLVQEYLNVRPPDIRWYYEVKTDDLRKILWYAQVEKGKQVKLRLEIKPLH